MKEMKKNVLAAVVLATAAWGQAALPAVRVDVRDTAGYYVATGVERVGTADGGAPIEWDGSRKSAVTGQPPYRMVS